MSKNVAFLYFRRVRKKPDTFNKFSKAYRIIRPQYLLSHEFCYSMTVVLVIKPNTIN